VRTPKENACGQGGTGQGIHQKTQTEYGNDSSLGTKEASETRISQLRAAMSAAAAAGDLATYQQHQAEHLKALSDRSPEQVHRLDAQHLAVVERAAELGDQGLRYVSAAWLETDAGRAVAWRNSRPVANDLHRDERRLAIGGAE
jgi:hypothetical protein